LLLWQYPGIFQVSTGPKERASGCFIYTGGHHEEASVRRGLRSGAQY
jgi:hypothetical protein